MKDAKETSGGVCGVNNIKPEDKEASSSSDLEACSIDKGGGKRRDFAPAHGDRQETLKPASRGAALKPAQARGGVQDSGARGKTGMPLRHKAGEVHNAEVGNLKAHRAKVQVGKAGTHRRQLRPVRSMPWSLRPTT